METILCDALRFTIEITKLEKAAFAMHCVVPDYFGQICTTHAQKLLFESFREKILKPPLDSTTPISNMLRIFWRSIDVYYVTLTLTSDPLILNIFSHVALRTGIILAKFEVC